MTDEEFVTNLILLGFESYPKGRPKNHDMFSTRYRLNVQLVNEWNNDYRIIKLYIRDPVIAGYSKFYLHTTTCEEGLDEILKYIATLRVVTSH